MLLELFLGAFPALPAGAAYLCAALLLLASGMGGIGVLQDVLLLALLAFPAHGTLQMAMLLPIAWSAIVAGDALSLWVGHRYGARWVRRPWAARFVPPRRLPALEAAVRRHAAPSSFLTRWLPGQRGLLFLLAGSLRVPWRPFLAGNAAAAALQVAVFAWGVRTLGWDWRRLAAPFDVADNVLTAIVVLVLFAWWIRARRPA